MKILVNGIMLFPLFNLMRNSTLLYPFQMHGILERTSSAFCTLPNWSANVYIVTFARPRILSRPLVKNPHFRKTVKKTLVFQHFQNSKNPFQIFSKNFHFFSKSSSKPFVTFADLRSFFQQMLVFRYLYAHFKTIKSYFIRSKLPLF